MDTRFKMQISFYFEFLLAINRRYIYGYISANILILKVTLLGITKSARFEVLLHQQQICSADLLPEEIQNIKKFPSWNGYPLGT